MLKDFKKYGFRELGSYNQDYVVINEVKKIFIGCFVDNNHCIISTYIIQSDIGPIWRKEFNTRYEAEEIGEHKIIFKGNKEEVLFKFKLGNAKNKLNDIFKNR